MPRLRSLSVAIKLPALMIAIALGCLGVAGAIAYNVSFAQLMQEVSFRLSAVADTRAALLEDWFDEKLEALGEFADEPQTVEATTSFLSAYRGLGLEANAQLRRSYIDENPNPPDAREALDEASETTAYSLFHKKFHAAMRSQVEAVDIADLLIVSAEGEVIYSVRKQGNFATNLDEGGGALGRAIRGALADGASFGFGDFAEDAALDGAVAGFLALPLANEWGDTVAALAFELDEAEVAAILAMPSALTPTTRLALVGPDFTRRSTSGLAGQSGALATTAPENPAFTAALGGEEGVTELTLPSGESVTAAYQPVRLGGPDAAGGTTWALLAAEPSEVIAAGPRALLAKLARAAIPALVVAFLVAGLSARNMARPLGRIAAAVGEVAAGNYESEIPAQKRGDEIGRISRALDALRRDLLQSRDELQSGASARAAMQRAQTEVVEALQTALSRLAEGDLGSTIAQEFPEDYAQLRSDFNRATDRLQQAMIDVSQSAASINHDVDHIAQASEELGQRTERQAATVEETAAALDQLTASVSEAARNAADVDGLVGKAREDAQASGEVVRETIEAIGVIEASFQQISGNIKVIDDIAFQTNLLALNAGVEAARAGDAGLGFAVVASEVRLLAQRCSEAASEINGQITASSDHVQNGVRLVGRTGGALKEIIEAIRTIADRVTAIAESAREQSTGLSELNSAVSELDMTTQKNAAMFEQTSAASSDLRTAAQGLRQNVGRFTLGSRTETWAGTEEAAPDTARRAASA
ncbi:methyl-accepting chemotaxis protein [Alloyangia pacifica]|uniref:Methyl-accepting chemotaxis protein n=1 Tax=Alloyangia pacifica TaxID=311180 RepID=A0A1I6NUG7_9RHOB|nr:methyl-accepting chemotaxis protein [Alloyangia pacifica]SDH60449.1 methyl-accepting chemotaxis protein [Alloyangia pacifica]SFS31602.1 methyl-accepting chemotaxis protein [Alloyangia pacifica]